MQYSEIKSKFIKKQLKNTSWKDRNYISDLLFIERFASGETFGGATGAFVQKLSDEYPKEWSEIFEESNPAWHKPASEQTKKKAKDFELLRQQKQLQEKKDRELWLKLGGKE